MHMPRMDGVELMRAVRSEVGFQDTRLAMLTSVTGNGAASRAAGADAYLTKPVRRADLFNALARLMGAASVEAPAKAAHGADAIDCRGARVLLAEDNAVNQEVALAMLQHAGCRVTSAANGRAAVAQWLEQPFDLVLMDCQMPELDGFDATREIRAAETGERARVPIVALTANAMEGDRERCLAAGMDDYLAKPFKRSDLVAVLRRWLDLTPRSRAACEERSKAPPAKEPRASTVPMPAAFDAAAFQNALPPGMGLDSPLARKLLRLFVGESAKLLAEVERAAAAADAQALFRAAHSLKSSGASVGASALSSLARELEALARAGESAALADHPARLRLAYERFCEDPAIRHLLVPEPAAPSAT